MEEYYFLFGLGALWTLFAVVQDLRIREVSNWLNFSLIALGLAYRAFYASAFRDWSFLYLGIAGFALFFLLALGFYYGRVFAGGDAKLLMGYGLLLPGSSIEGVVLYGLGFVFLLFLMGALWSICYAGYLALGNLKGFKNEFFYQCKRQKLLLVFVFLALIFSASFFSASYFLYWLATTLLIFALPFLSLFVVAVEKSCMIKLVSPDKLTEGDWLEKEVKLAGRRIKKSVHGLSTEEIAVLKKAGKKVWIKEGVPFTPAFLLVLGITVFFSEALLYLKEMLFSLF